MVNNVTQESSRGKRRNNNIDYIYLYSYSDLLSYKDITLVTGIDKITIWGIDFRQYDLIGKFLTSQQFRCVSDFKIKDDTYERIAIYKSEQDDSVIEIFHGFRASYKGKWSLKIIIQDPNGELLSSLHSALVYNGNAPIDTELELSFDFFTPEPYLLRRFLDTHLYLMGQRKAPFYIEDTSYLNDIRKSKYGGMKVYIKPLSEYYHGSAYKFVRMELTLKRKKIYELGLELPLLSIDGIDLPSIFSFQTIDFPGLRKYLLAKHQIDFERNNPARKIYDSLQEEQIQRYVDCVIYEPRIKCLRIIQQKPRRFAPVTVYEPVFMGQLRQMKQSIKNYNRFFNPCESFNDRFLSEVKSQSFLKPKNQRRQLLLEAATKTGQIEKVWNKVA